MHSKYKNQSGATLVVALVILLVMSIIGISTMKSSSLQERMAGNARQKAISKNAALVAMREAEFWLRDNVPGAPMLPDLSVFDGSASLYSATARPGASAVPIPNTVDVTAPSDWNGIGVHSTGVSNGLVSQQPRYVIEYLGKKPIRGEGRLKVTSFDEEDENNQVGESYLFRITAIGWGKDVNISTVLQSTYATGIE